MSQGLEGLEQKLHRLSPAALLVGMEGLEAEQGGRPVTDTTYDRFLWNYVGDPVTGQAANMYQSSDGQEYCYSEPLSLSFSEEGTLAAVRRARAERLNDPPRRYMVATADLVNRTITEWHVADVEYTWRGDSLRTVLRLSERQYRTVPAQAEGESDDILYSILRDKSLALATAQARRLMPRFVLQSHDGGNNFTDASGLTQQLSPISELTTQVNYFRSKLAPEVRRSREAAGHQVLGSNVVALFQSRRAV